MCVHVPEESSCDLRGVVHGFNARLHAYNAVQSCIFTQARSVPLTLEKMVSGDVANCAVCVGYEPNAERHSTEYSSNSVDAANLFVCAHDGYRQAKKRLASFETRGLDSRLELQGFTVKSMPGLDGFPS